MPGVLRLDTLLTPNVPGGIMVKQSVPFYNLVFC